MLHGSYRFTYHLFHFVLYQIRKVYYIKEHLHRTKSHSSQTLSLSKQIKTTTTTTTTRRQEDEENERGIIHVIKNNVFRHHPDCTYFTFM